MPITEICFAAGFNNISNFNRQFLAQKGMPPSRFRALLAENARAAAGRAAVRTRRNARRPDADADADGARLRRHDRPQREESPDA